MPHLDSLALPLRVREHLRGPFREVQDVWVGASPGEDAEDVAELVDSGVWSMIPVVAGKATLVKRAIGPMLTPEGCGWDAWWAAAQDGGVSTLCAGAEYLADRLLVARLTRDRDEWREMRESWTARSRRWWQEIAEALSATPGCGEAILFDETWFPEPGEELREKGVRPAARLLAAVDRHEDTQRLAAFFESGTSPEPCGIWTTRWRAELMRRVGANYDLSEEAVAVVLAATELALGRDTQPTNSGAAVLGIKDSMMMPGALEDAGAYYDNRMDAEELDRAPFLAAPLGPAFLAWAAAGDRYSGKPHFEAAAQLDLAGDPRRAWTALESAAFFMRHTPGAPMCLEAALSLAERNHFPVAGILGEMFALYRKARPDYVPVLG